MFGLNIDRGMVTARSENSAGILGYAFGRFSCAASMYFGWWATRGILRSKAIGGIGTIIGLISTAFGIKSLSLYSSIGVIMI